MRKNQQNMSETLLMSATADVMLYEDNVKQWVRPGDNGSLATISNCGTPDTQKLSTVQLWQDCNKTVFRITAKRIYDGKLLIEQTIFQKLKYQAATKCFHQWRSENRQVFGLSFSSEQDAEKFLLMVQQAMEYASSMTELHYSSANSSGNGINTHYQESWYQQQQQLSNHCKEPDQDSIGSANGVSINMANTGNIYRKSSYSVNVINGMNTISAVNSSSIVQPQQQYSQYQHQQVSIQRRASQGSNNSSSTNSSGAINGGNGIYNQTNGSNYHSNAMNINRLNINGPSSNVQSMNSLQHSVPAETATSSSSVSLASAPAAPPPPPGIPPISNSAPPPPPPPPPSSLKNGNHTKPLSFADQLKQAQLRNTSSTACSSAIAVNRTSSSSGDTGIGSKTSTISSTNSGHSDLLSELAATINKRNKANVISTNTETVEKRSNGEVPTVYRPWQKTNTNTTSNNISVSNSVIVESPKVHRKAASGSSLSSQEETTSKNGGNNSTTPPITTPTGVVTLSDLERFKQELIVELNKTKQEILNAIRQELAQHFQQK